MSFLLILLVLRKKDFPFDDVPIPKVTYVDDAQREVTLKCDFDVPPGGYVSFEIQWFVNGKGLGHVACDDPDKSTCGQLGSKDYELGDQVVLSSFFLSYIFLIYKFYRMLNSIS